MALPAAISTAVAEFQADGIGIFELWTVQAFIIFFGFMLVIKLFKRYGNKI